MQPNIQDIVKPYDPSGYGSISGVQLAQLIDGAAPSTDRGMVLLSSDVAGNPTVPDANTNTKWQRYIWLRIGASSVGMYVWNPSGASDATFLQWQPAFQASIPAASIQGYQIAPNTITDVNIANLSYSKLIGAPSGLVPTGPAGGSLTGTYPNPSIGAQQVTTAMIALVNITNDLIADGTIDIQNKIKVTGVWTAKQNIRVNDAATGLIGETKLITQIAEPTVTENNEIVVVNNDHTAFTYSSAKTIVTSGLSAMLFTSAELAIPAAGATTGNIAHGLGAIPSFIRWVLVCKTAEAGYNIGDELDIMGAGTWSSVDQPAFMHKTDVTNLVLIRSSTVTAGNIEVQKISATTGSNFGITEANWKLKAYARL